MLKNFLEKCADIILSVPHNKGVLKQLRVGDPLLHLLAQTPGDQVVEGVGELAAGETGSRAGHHLEISFI